MSGNGEIPGITIYGTSLLTEQYCNEPWMEFSGSVFTDPVYIPAVTIDQLIQDGHWTAGQLDGVRTDPGPDEWPDRWRGLKTR